MEWYTLKDVNPEPWAIGPLGVKRAGGKLIPFVGRNQQQWNYQQAVKEILKRSRVIAMHEGPVEIRLYFWQRRDEISTQKGKGRRKEFDLTNMIKSTEDAMQGILLKNDNQTFRVLGTIVERNPDTEPKVVLAIAPWDGFDAGEIPATVWAQLIDQPALSDNSWGDAQSEELF